MVTEPQTKGRRGDGRVCARLLRAREARLQRCPSPGRRLRSRRPGGRKRRCSSRSQAAETADIGDVGQEVRNESGLFRPNGGLVVEASAEHRSGEIDRLAHVDRLAVAKGPRAERGGEALAADQVVDHADGIDAVDPRRDRHREARQIADEVRGAVDRVDDPDDSGLRRLVCALLAEESVVGASVEQNADDRLLCPSVHGGDHVGRTRLRVDAQITTSVGGRKTGATASTAAWASANSSARSALTCRRHGRPRRPPTHSSPGA